LAFFAKFARPVPRRYDIIVIYDNLSAHMGAEITDWPAEPPALRLGVKH
jgi:hypothetical protein